jgi:(p)ppGpp synthase/HD superfamily hydrolase
MIPEKDFGFFLAALRFSADKHRNQRRKDPEKNPYINHPIQVAETLWSVGGITVINTLVAAILHDTIEDTDTSPAEIQCNFGEAVLDLVLEVSDNKSLPKMERKRLQVENAPHKSPAAKCLKLADFICNLREYTNPRQQIGRWNASRGICSGLKRWLPACAVSILRLKNVMIWNWHAGRKRSIFNQASFHPSRDL